ncbi:MAG: glycosyltransferase [Firmicutes bacterium]|nr:glycosyltransferase [Bacillota bacterium]
MNDEIKVSICCVTYNQQEYIKQALDSFVNQKTTFNYEIIIHDDASNDNTVKIIKEYAKKYPNLIIPILQKENQYSKKPNSILEFCFGKARGEYIALCDGDDGFLDKDKLMEQAKILDKNSEISLCTHDTKIVNDNGEYIENISAYPDGIVNIKMFLNNSKSMHTSSMMFRKKDIINLPDYFHCATVGDLPLKLHLLSLGNCYHIDKVMSFYRTESKGSWSLQEKKDVDKLEKNHEMEMNIYNMFNQKTNYKYDELVKSRILLKEFNYYLKTNNFDELYKKKYNSLYKKLSFKKRLKLKIKKIKFIYNIYLKMIGR